MLSSQAMDKFRSEAITATQEVPKKQTYTDSISKFSTPEKPPPISVLNENGREGRSSRPRPISDQVERVLLSALEKGSRAGAETEESDNTPVERKKDGVSHIFQQCSEQKYQPARKSDSWSVMPHSNTTPLLKPKKRYSTLNIDFNPDFTIQQQNKKNALKPGPKLKTVSSDNDSVYIKPMLPPAQENVSSMRNMRRHSFFPWLFQTNLHHTANPQRKKSQVRQTGPYRAPSVRHKTAPYNPPVYTHAAAVIQQQGRHKPLRRMSSRSVKGARRASLFFTSYKKAHRDMNSIPENSQKMEEKSSTKISSLTQSMEKAPQQAPAPATQQQRPVSRSAKTQMPNIAQVLQPTAPAPAAPVVDSPEPSPPLNEPSSFEAVQKVHVFHPSNKPVLINVVETGSNLPKSSQASMVSALSRSTTISTITAGSPDSTPTEAPQDQPRPPATGAPPSESKTDDETKRLSTRPRLGLATPAIRMSDFSPSLPIAELPTSYNRTPIESSPSSREYSRLRPVSPASSYTTGNASRMSPPGPARAPPNTPNTPTVRKDLPMVLRIGQGQSSTLDARLRSVENLDVWERGLGVAAQSAATTTSR